MEKSPQVQWAIAKVTREAREKTGLSQEELADFSRLSHSYISNLERGRKGVSITTFLQLAKALETSGTELMRRTEHELDNTPTPPEIVPGRPYKRKSAKK